MLFAQFVRCYGAPTLFGPWPWTADGTIPWRLFLALLRRMDAVYALDRLNLAHGVGIGAALAMGGDKKLASAEVGRAFPIR